MRQTTGNFMKNATVKQVADNFIKKLKYHNHMEKYIFREILTV